MSGEEPNIDTRDLLRWGDEGPQYDRPPHDGLEVERPEMTAQQEQFLLDAHSEYMRLVSGHCHAVSMEGWVRNG